MPKNASSPPFEVTARLWCDKKEERKKHKDENREWLSGKGLGLLRQRLNAELVGGERSIQDDDNVLVLAEKRVGYALDKSFRDSVADMLRGFIESVDPIIEQVLQDQNE